MSASLAAHAAMDDNSQTHWYLVRTKTGKERWVRDQLAHVVPEVFLPMLKAKAPRWGRMAESVGALFPCYVFARLDLQLHYFDVKYLAGVRGIVSAGADPLAVPDAIVSEIRRRGINDIVEDSRKTARRRCARSGRRGAVSRLRGDLPALHVGHRARGDFTERGRDGRA